MFNFVLCRLETVLQMLENVKSSLEKLLARYEAVSAENAELRDRLAKAESQEKAFREQIIELNNQIDSLTLKAAFTAGDSRTDNTKAKAKVEKLIKEIDKCIALMER